MKSRGSVAAARPLRNSLVPGLTGIDEAALALQAERIFRSRRSRAQRFGKAMFGEPAWDMLLVLYIGECRGCPRTANGLTGFSGAPSGIALRWLDFLIAEGLVSRETRTVDGADQHVRLTDSARAAMTSYLADSLVTWRN